MKQKSLANWLRAVLIGVGLCGVLLYALIVPMLSESMVERYPEFSDAKWPWLGLIWLTAIPCFLALISAWRIAVNIGSDRSFSAENAALLKRIAILAGGDAALLFLGNLIYLLLDMNHPSILLLSLFIEFVGIAVSVVAAALSHLVMKASALQEQSDLTI